MVGMKIYPRIYTELLRRHLAENRQMALMSGPRQVGRHGVSGAGGRLPELGQPGCKRVDLEAAAVASFAGLQNCMQPDALWRSTRFTATRAGRHSSRAFSMSMAKGWHGGDRLLAAGCLQAGR